MHIIFAIVEVMSYASHTLADYLIYFLLVLS